MFEGNSPWCFYTTCVSFRSRRPFLALQSTQAHSKLEVVSFLRGKGRFASSPGQQRWYLSVEQSLDRTAYSSLKDWKLLNVGFLRWDLDTSPFPRHMGPGDNGGRCEHGTHASCSAMSTKCLNHLGYCFHRHRFWKCNKSVQYVLKPLTRPGRMTQEQNGQST